jgi:hypothetical protein
VGILGIRLSSPGTNLGCAGIDRYTATGFKTDLATLALNICGQFTIAHVLPIIEGISTLPVKLVNKPPTKAEIRAQLDKAVNDFVNEGGSIQQVAQGISGREASEPIRPQLFDGPKTTRTYVNDLVASVDARKGGKASAASHSQKSRKPKQKLILDDFGEPVRKVWVEE